MWAYIGERDLGTKRYETKKLGQKDPGKKNRGQKFCDEKSYHHLYHPSHTLVHGRHVDIHWWKRSAGDKKTGDKKIWDKIFCGQKDPGQTEQGTKVLWRKVLTPLLPYIGMSETCETYIAAHLPWSFRQTQLSPLGIHSRISSGKSFNFVIQLFQQSLRMDLRKRT